MAQQTDLEVNQGATYLVPFVCEVDDAIPDFSGWYIKFLVKKNFTDDNADAIINETIIPDPVTGEGAMTLEDEDTAEYEAGDYLYQGVVVDGDGNVAKTIVGTFRVLDTVYKGPIT
jgi:hypothetical protein